MLPAPSDLVAPVLASKADTLKSSGGLAGQEMLAMRYERWTLGVVVLLASSAVSPSSQSESPVTASASMRIILQVPHQVSLSQTEDPAFDELCLKRMPVSSFRVYVRDIGEAPDADAHFFSNNPSLCIPVTASQPGKLVFIVAE